jgi:hypothetical protein
MVAGNAGMDEKMAMVMAVVGLVAAPPPSSRGCHRGRHRVWWAWTRNI